MYNGTSLQGHVWGQGYVSSVVGYTITKTKSILVRTPEF